MRRSIQYNFCYNKKIFGLCFGKNSETVEKNDGGTIGSDGSPDKPRGKNL